MYFIQNIYMQIALPILHLNTFLSQAATRIYIHACLVCIYIVYNWYFLSFINFNRLCFDAYFRYSLWFLQKITWQRELKS